MYYVYYMEEIGQLLLSRIVWFHNRCPMYWTLRSGVWIVHRTLDTIEEGYFQICLSEMFEF